MVYRPSFVLIVEVPLLTLHICVSAVIAWEICRKNRTFSSGFYKLLVVQNIADILSYGMTSVVIYDVIPRPWYHGIWSNICLATTQFCTTYQLVAHAGIALNRYSALVHPYKHTEWWSPFRTLLVLLTMFSISLPIFLMRGIDDLVIVETEHAVFMTNSKPWINIAGALIMVIIGFGSTALCFVLELRTAIVFRRFVAQNRLKYRQDFQLLVYAMMQFVVQTFLVVNYALVLLSLFTKIPNIFMYSYPYTIDFMSLSGSVFLVMA
ncbi:hypothetical protein AAVH_19103, partial [Aphelenchoides avenae]